jgi:hypothetical protein
MCTSCVSLYEVHMGCWITKLLLKFGLKL